MARKLQLISELAGRTAQEVAQDVDSWKRYLDTASRLYKYKFDDQLLIYAQRPDAVACASMEVWNGKMSRWIRPGSKGIALIHESESGRPRLEYVFDVSDTRPVRGAKMPYLWEMREEHHASVLAALEARHGESSTQEIGGRLMEAAASSVNNVYQEYLQDLAYDVEGSFLEGRDAQAVGACFRDTLTASVQYALLARCGLEPSDYLDDKALGGITEFSTPAALHHLGDAASTLSKGILQEIGRAVHRHDLETVKSPQKKIEKPLEKASGIGYTKDVNKFNDLKRESKGGGINDGRTDLYEERGLPDTRPDDGRGGRSGGDAFGEIRDAAPGLPQGTPSRDIHFHAADGEADAAPVPDRSAGTGAGRPDGGRDDEEKRRGRGPERTRPDGMDPGGEQLHGTGRGDSPPGDRVPIKQGESEDNKQETAGIAPAVFASETAEAADVAPAVFMPEKQETADRRGAAVPEEKGPLKEAVSFQLSLFPTVEEQVEHIAEAQAEVRQAEKKEPPLSASQKPAGVPKSIACRILTSGGNEEGSILRIVAFFQKQPSMPDAAAFLRQEYGTGGKGVNVAGKDYAVWFQKEGIFLTPGRSINGPGCTLVPWEKAAALITQLLKDGVYAEQEKLDAARENEYGELAAKLWYLRQDFNEKAVEMGLMPGLSKLYGGFPESTGRIAALLKEKDSRDAMIGELSSFIHAYKELPGLLRFPRLHDPENLFKRLSDLELPWEQYQASRGFEAARASFITEDEINRLLTQGSNVSQGKFRIYSYFMQGHDEKECAAFLRDEYGTGGYGYYGCNEWHDSKGMTFIRGDDLSGFQGYDTVKMNWNQVQKHIRGLIGAGKYMNGKELAYIPEYEKLQLARSIYTFHYYASRTLHGGIDGWDEKAAERDFLPALDSPEESAALYKNMVETFVLMSPEDGQAYQAMQEAIDGMAAYQRGEYSLFTPLPEETLRSQRMEREAAQKAEKEKISIKKPEKEPAGELEAAAQALARKQRKKELEEPDGQLAFDFTLDGMAGLETGGSKNGPAEPEMSVSEVEGPLEAAEPLKATESGQPRKVQADKKVRSEAETHPAKDTETRQSEKSFLTLYRETLAVLIDTVQKSGMGSYLRDRDLDYDSAAAELDGELDYFIAELADSQPELYAAFQSLPMFRQWMVEDVLEYTYQDISDGKDAATRHAGEAGLPAWVKGDDAAPVQNAAGHGGEEKAAPDVPKNPEKQDLAPNVEEYLNLKLQYPDKLVGVQVGDYYLFYGKDAQAAARALGTKLAVQEIPGLGETAITGGRTWQAILKNLLEHGHSVVIASPEPARGENAPYQIVKERDISEYIPLGMELAIDGRRMKVDSVDYENGRVSLKDLELQGWFPVFRQEPVGFIRGCVEQEMEKNSFMAGLEEKNNSGKGTDTEQAEKETADSTGLEETADSDGLKEAQRLIEDFCYNEYGGGGVDFDNPEHIEVAYTETEDGRHEIQAEVNLVDYSMYQYLDGVCVDRRSYGSIRELIDAELSGLDFDALVRLNAEAEALLEAQAEPEADSQDSMLSVEAVVTESGQAATEKTVGVYNKGLPYEIVVQEISVTPKRHNYRIADNALGTGGQKVKYQNNIAAIRTLKQIEAENRLATQEVLAKYVGWGGLAQAFDPHNEKWAGEYARLKELLTSEEYGSARSTVLNAHYTSPAVIQAIYGAVSAMDFTPGNILEPSCGIGNFFGLVPEKYGDAKLYGVELDSITGRIAKQLYQKADITVGGFEDTQHPEDFFDLAVGNVPFGEYKVHDRQYDRQNLLIHDYFLTKAIDKVRPGGIVAFITSKGTMDKADSRAREGLAQKADLLGAIRLPNNAFKANAGTSVTTDILFFQKRGSAPEKLPDWVNTGQTEEGVPLNNYFLQHPQMVLGKMAFWENMYGNKTETACLPTPGEDLSVQLSEAVKHITPPDRALLHLETPGQEEQGPGQSIPADPDVRNFSFTEKDGKLYFRENSRMTLAEPGKMQAARIRGMIGIRDSARKLIDLQLNGAGDGDIQAEQAHLNALYDDFQKKYGLLNSAGNRLAFRQDASYPLLCSLEVLDQEGNLKRKADMFTRRTIRHRQPVTSVDTAAEAFGVSIGERACVDLEYMASLMGGSGRIPQIVSDLKGIIFKDPATGPFDFSPENEDWKDGWQAADEYLSGDVRQKLEAAREAAKTYPEFAVNVEALEKVQPKDLTAPEINARIGAPWIDTEYYRQFLFEQLQTPEKLRQGKIAVMYSDVTGEWRIKGKHEDSRTNARVWNTYGTKRINAYEVFEASLNQRSVQIFDKKEVDGREVRVLNEKETAVAQQKQEALKEAFRGWIFKDPQRRADLCATYNRLFNSTRPRAYDGQHISFTGMNPEIRLEPHQRNAVARILYGKNSLLAHVVGAGKTYEMAAAAMESKRLGLCKKSMIVVPNHLTEQWGSDFLTLYPGAKVLVATKKDFEPKNRKKFCARISTGDYDAVIIGHSQFEKIPVSPDRQKAIIQEQIDEIVAAIAEAKAEKEEDFTVKQMEKMKKNLEAKMKRLYDKKKDDTVYFEELGIDRLFVDEAHAFKNLYMHTKMRNVAGISQTDAQKSSDMFAKCRYMDEITGGRGVTFATGTPVSNSMVELYTMMRYLQYDMLEQGYKDSTGKTRSLKHFDNWAATFGEQVTAVELKPEGTGFRLKTRFARFYNLPELISRWKEAADIQTAEMLKLPVPEAEYITIQTEPSEAQKLMVQGLADRAEKIRKLKLDPRIDNMLKVTSDGRKLALDQRIMNPLLPDDPGSKVNACVENVFKIWQESTPRKGAQLIFSDLSTPKGRAEPDKGHTKNCKAGPPAGKEAAAAEETVMEASVYEDIRKKLIAKGIPPEQVAFIHDANTEMQKAELFAKVRSGQVRVLLGSTQKMGAGTNVQTKLVASHDLDCPWRPADLEQRAGRIVRRGNENDHVKIFRYVTKGTFDAYTWGLVEAKQKFIGQIMTSKSPARSIEDVDAAALSYAEVKMLATGDARIKEKMDLDIQVAKLKMLQSDHLAQQYEMQDRVRGYFPNKIKETQLYIDCLEADLPLLEAHPVKEDAFSMTIMGTAYADRSEAGKAVIAACRLMDDPGREIALGEYRGFQMKLCFNGSKFNITMKQHLTYTAELSDDAVGNIARINNALEKIPQSLERHREKLENLHKEMESAKEEAARPFAQEAELAEKSARLAELNTALGQEEKKCGQEPGQDGAVQQKPEEKVQETTQDKPAQENTGKPDPAGRKPSILQKLKEYHPPARVQAKTGCSREMEVG